LFIYIIFADSSKPLQSFETKKNIIAKNSMLSPRSQEKKLKQQYLCEEIIEQNYDPDEFTEWMDTQRENGKTPLNLTKRLRYRFLDIPRTQNPRQRVQRAKQLNRRTIRRLRPRRRPKPKW
jgi:hypothetical protein